jgi:hypothetical protein
MPSNLVVDNATHHKKKRGKHATRKTCTHMFLSCNMRLLKKLRLKKKCIDFHSNFNCLGRQPLRDRGSNNDFLQETWLH